MPPKPVKELVPVADQDKWPAWVKLIAVKQEPQDIGVGDTAQRLLAKLGGEVFKKMLKRACLPCGCDVRQFEWNVLYPYTQPEIDSLLAVTSVSPLPKHSEIQHRAFDSWKRFGLRIAAVNTQSEIDQMQYPQIDQWIASDDEVTWGTNRRSQPVRNLFSVATDRRIMVINSDIEIHGPQHTLLDSLDERPALGIRWNYQKRYDQSTEFQWGFDVMIVTPEQAARLPEKFRYGIGQPVWDYAAPLTIGGQWNVLHTPLFYHREHALNWDSVAWEQGAKMFRDLMGQSISSENTAQWRQQFEPDMVYEGGRYVYRTDH